MVENVIIRSLLRRQFLWLAGAAAVAAPSPIYAEQREVSEPAFSGIATFEEVWRTVRDRFYDPQFRGLNWDDVRDRYIWEAARATSQNELAGVINRMLSQLRASHTRYYTSDEPEYYQLADIFAGALRRRGLQRAFPDGRISYRGIGIN